MRQDRNRQREAGPKVRDRREERVTRRETDAEKG